MKKAEKNGIRDPKERFPKVTESLLQLLDYPHFSVSKSHVLIEIGLGTTATRGLARDLEMVNFTTMHYHSCFGPRCHICKTQTEAWKNFDFAKDIPSIYAFLFDFLSSSCYDAYADTPIPHLLPYIFRIFPDAKYVYTTRDPKEWWNSRSMHVGYDVLFDVNGPMGSLANIINSKHRMNSVEGPKLYKAYDNFVRCLFSRFSYLELNYFTKEAYFHEKGRSRKLEGGVSEILRKFALGHQL